MRPRKKAGLGNLTGTFSWTPIADQRVYNLLPWKWKALEKKMHFRLTSRSCFYSRPFWSGCIYKVLGLKGNKLLLIYTKTERLWRKGFHLTTWRAADRETEARTSNYFIYCGPPVTEGKKNPKTRLSFHSCSAHYREVRSPWGRKHSLCFVSEGPWSTSSPVCMDRRAIAHPARILGSATWEVDRHFPWTVLQLLLHHSAH